jgi:CDP-diacylglycerol--serine O-phosphatidyltransferase
MTELNESGNWMTYLPNSITFLSLVSGLISIIFSSQGLILLAAWCVLLCNFLDYWDGFLARKLDLSSSFGLQLDSLVDMVSFGVAPMLLIWQHLDLDIAVDFWILPVFVLQVIAGAFRLARFNLQPPKLISNGETMGITISQAGMVIALTVLSDLTLDSYSLPNWTFLLLSLFLSYVMVSRLVFPPPSWYAPSKISYLIYLLLGIILIYFTSVFTMLLVIYLGGLIVSISKQILLPSTSFNR